jgi:SAM-dependent methyltransferase
VILPNIEIGGGTLHVPDGCHNLDPRHGHGEWRRGAQDIPWPTPDASIGNIRASHVMEHIPAGQDRIDVMNEAWRVLIPGGTFQIIVPLIIGLTQDTPRGQSSERGMLSWISWPAIADPTHVSFWCIESFSYFDGTSKMDADYGIKLWRTLDLGVRAEWEGRWTGSPAKEE